MSKLQELLDRHSRIQDWPERHARRDEWIAAIGRLIAQVRNWLAVSDPKGVLALETGTMQCGEPELGLYHVSYLLIGLDFDKEVFLEPVKRDTVGEYRRLRLPKEAVEGCAQLIRGLDRVLLYRRREGGEDHWYMMDENFDWHLFDRSRLEAALIDLFERR